MTHKLVINNSDNGQYNEIGIPLYKEFLYNVDNDYKFTGKFVVIHNKDTDDSVIGVIREIAINNDKINGDTMTIILDNIIEDNEGYKFNIERVEIMKGDSIIVTECNPDDESVEEFMSIYKNLVLIEKIKNKLETSKDMNSKFGW